jgi:hypothetical protein
LPVSLSSVRNCSYLTSCVEVFVLPVSILDLNHLTSTIPPKDLVSMTAPEKPTIVFVPGAFHVPAHYSDIIAELQSRSYPALCVSLALTGSENPNLPPTASIDGVRQTLASLVNAGKEVLVVCHSAGAVAVAPCVKGLERSSGGDENGRGCVIGIVFMCAWLVPEGKAHLDILPGQGLPPWAEMEVRGFLHLFCSHRSVIVCCSVPATMWSCLACHIMDVFHH